MGEEVERGREGLPLCMGLIISAENTRSHEEIGGVLQDSQTDNQ